MSSNFPTPMRNALFIILLATTFMARAQRNLLIIIADDLSPDYFGFYEIHGDTVDVPNIRKLASKGVRFTNAMSNPLCSPTRAGILTGRYSFRTGVGNVVAGNGSTELDTSEITIPRLLKMYNPNIIRADIGKWHLHNPQPAKLTYPNLLGYDHYEGPFIGQLASYTNWTKYTNGVSSTITNYATSENVNNAISWLKTQPNKPFFLWLAFNAPHTPYHLPPANLHSYTLSGTTQDINQNPKKYFKAMLQALDHEIGRFFDSLKTINRWDSTDIIFIGDNGNTQNTAQNNIPSQAKGTIYQYGVNVPMIIFGPSVKNPGRVSQALVNTTDIFATSLELMGFSNWSTNIPAQKPVDSKSLLPIIKNTGTEIRPWAFTEIFKITHDSDEGKAIRNLDYKLIKFDYGKEEFYNLNKDPNETNNLLLNTLNSTELTNYNYLCNQLNLLIGNTAFCNTSVSLNPITKLNYSIPNPFCDFINLPLEYRTNITILYNSKGQIIYNGLNLSHTNLSRLPAGIYYLQIPEKSISLKLIKQ